MKLIINIDKEKLSIIKNKMYCGIYDSDLYKAIENGTPLDDVLEQIKAKIDSHCSDNRDRNDGLYIAMKIIDKYREVK